MPVNVVQPVACLTTFFVDGALLSISLAGHGQLVKMLITLVHVPHSIFGSNFAYLFILIVSGHWYA